jgi:hypothetical protein
MDEKRVKRIRCLRRNSANGALYLSCDDLVLACLDSPETRILRRQLARSALSHCESSPRTIHWVCGHGEGYGANVKSSGIYPFPAVFSRKWAIQVMRESCYSSSESGNPSPEGLYAKSIPLCSKSVRLFHHSKDEVAPIKQGDVWRVIFDAISSSLGYDFV